MRFFLPVYLTIVIIVLSSLAAMCYKSITDIGRRVASRAVSLALPDRTDGPAMDCD